MEIGQILGWDVSSTNEFAGEVFDHSIDQISFRLSFISIIIYMIFQADIKKVMFWF